MNSLFSQDQNTRLRLADIINRYERIRKAKMYANRRSFDRKIDVRRLQEFLQTITDPVSVSVRFHYQIIGRHTRDDLPDRSIAIFDRLTQNLSDISITKITHHEPTGTIIWEVSTQTSVRQLIKLLPFQFDLLEQCSLLEIKVSQSNGTTQYRSFEGIRYQHPPVQYFLDDPTKTLDIIPSVQNYIPRPGHLESWVSLLYDRWDLFFRDVRYKECALDCWRDGRYFVRRTWLDGERAIFYNESSLDRLRQVQAMSVVPNIHPVEENATGMVEPLEAVIDLDPISNSQEELVFELSNSFAEYLKTVGITFNRRLSSGHHGGVHFLIPLKLQQQLPLLYASSPYETYIARNRKDVLINSLRHTLEGLVLHYLVYYVRDPEMFKDITLGPNRKKIRFDVSRNVRYGGRRSIFSAHIRTNNVVVPIPPDPIGFSEYEYYCDISGIDKIKKYINDFMESDLSALSVRQKNARKLHQIGEEIADVWETYMSENSRRFWNVTLQNLVK